MKRMRIMRLAALALALILFVGMLAGCAATASNSMAPGSRGGSVVTEGLADKEMEFDMSVTVSGLQDGRKRIVTAEMSVQTKEFSNLSENLRKAVGELGGYIESVSTRERSAGMRYAEYVVRIPPERLEKLCEQLGEQGTVVSYSEAAKDVTESYIDTESHIAALKGERDALLELLEKSGSLSDVLEVRGRLTEVIAELESYEATLRSYDAQIAYAKLSLYVNEVEREMPVEKPGLWGEIGSRIAESAYEIGSFFRTLFVGIAGNIIYFAILAVIAAVAVILLRRSLAKRKQKKTETEN